MAGEVDVIERGSNSLSAAPTVTRSDLWRVKPV